MYSRNRNLEINIYKKVDKEIPSDYTVGREKINLLFRVPFLQ